MCVMLSQNTFTSHHTEGLVKTKVMRALYIKVRITYWNLHSIKGLPFSHYITDSVYAAYEQPF